MSPVHRQKHGNAMFGLEQVTITAYFSGADFSGNLILDLNPSLDW